MNTKCCIYIDGVNIKDIVDYEERICLAQMKKAIHKDKVGTEHMSPLLSGTPLFWRGVRGEACAYDIINKWIKLN